MAHDGGLLSVEHDEEKTANVQHFRGLVAGMRGELGGVTRDFRRFYAGFTWFYAVLRGFTRDLRGMETIVRFPSAMHKFA